MSRFSSAVLVAPSDEAGQGRDLALGLANRSRHVSIYSFHRARVTIIWLGHITDLIKAI